MIAVDTNILVYAHRRDSLWHDGASRLLQGLAQGKTSWAVAWHCLHEFISVVTNKRIYQPASTQDEALNQIDLWMQSPSLQLLSEQPGYWNDLKAIVKPAQVSGPQIYDARIAALCLHHGVRELWTADRDFQKFPALKTRNPLVG